MVLIFLTLLYVYPGETLLLEAKLSWLPVAFGIWFVEKIQLPQQEKEKELEGENAKYRPVGLSPFLDKSCSP
jgi:hypothetical protein